MTVTVVIPWREQPDRVAAFNKVVAWWEGNGFTVITADSDHEHFNISAARNNGVEHAATEQVIIADADTIPELSNVREALTNDGVTWPFTVYRYMGKHAPEIYDLPASPFERDMKGSFGGLFVTTKRTYWALGGQDEQFRVWGYEDQAFRNVAQTLSTVHRTPGYVYAYGHDAPRIMTRDNPGRHRVQLYMFASGKPDIMRELIRERAR